MGFDSCVHPFPLHCRRRLDLRLNANVQFRKKANHKRRPDGRSFRWVVRRFQITVPDNHSWRGLTKEVYVLRVCPSNLV